MDARWGRVAAIAAKQHSAFSIADMESVGITGRMRSTALRCHVIEPIGPKTFRFAGDGPRWEQTVAAAQLDLGPNGFAAGRTGAALLGLDGFTRDHVEMLVPRELRGRRIAGIVASTVRPITAFDVCRVDGFHCLRAERLILEAPLFHFTTDELENAIDSAERLGLVADCRLRDRVLRERSLGVNGTRALVKALVDSGGHSKLERRFLSICRKYRLPRPQLQVRHVDGTRTYARVDAFFSPDLVVELDGHRTHSSRKKLQTDAQRRTELTVRARRRVLTFTGDDVFGRPAWVASQIIEALAGNLAS